MKKSIYILTLFFLLSNISCKVELFSCLTDEGNIETRVIEIDPISGVEIDLNADVVIVEGPTQRIEVTAHSNVIDEIIDDSKINGEKWEIEVNGCSDISEIGLRITLPTIKGVDVNGTASVRTEGVFNNIDKINLEIDGDGEIDFQMGTVSKVDLQINGAGEIRLSGITADQSIDIAGTGIIRNFDLLSSTTRFEISGDADCQISVEDVLQGELSGSGRICYRGNPGTFNIEQSGTIKVEDCN